MSKKKRECRNCKFFDDTDHECRIDSPKFVSFSGARAAKIDLAPLLEGYWPHVEPESWCGKFKRSRKST